MPHSGGGSRGGVGSSAHAEEGGGSQRSMRLRRHASSTEVGGEGDPPTLSSQSPHVGSASHSVSNKRSRKRKRQEFLVAYKTAILEVVTKERDQVEAELRALVGGSVDTDEQQKAKSISIMTPLSQREIRGRMASNALTATPEKEKQGRSKGKNQENKLLHGGDHSSRYVTSPRAYPSSSSVPTSPVSNQASPRSGDGERGGGGFTADSDKSPSLAAYLSNNVTVKKELVPAKETDSASHASIGASSEALRMKEEVSMIKDAMVVMDEPAGVVIADVRGLPPDADDDAVHHFVLGQLAPTESPGLLAVSAAQDHMKTLDNNRGEKKRHINGDDGIETKGMSRFQQAQAFEDLINAKEAVQNRLKVFTKVRRRPYPPLKLDRRRPVHWSYLLLEMAAMATDFHEERKWKVDAAYKAARASGIRANASKMGSLLWATDAMVANKAIAMADHMCRYLHLDECSTPSKVYNNHLDRGSTTSAERMEALETVLQRVEEVVRTNGEGEEEQREGNNSSEENGVTRSKPNNTLSSTRDEADLQAMKISPVATNGNDKGGGTEIKEVKAELNLGCRSHHADRVPLRQELPLLPFQEDAIRLVQQLHAVGVGTLVKGSVGQGKTVAVCGLIRDIVERDLAHASQVTTTSDRNEAPLLGSTVNGFTSTSTSGGAEAAPGEKSSPSPSAAASTTADGEVVQTTTTPRNENHIHTTAAVQQSSPVNSSPSPIHPVQPHTPKQDMLRQPPLPILILCPAISLLRWFAELSNCNSSLRVELWEDWRSDEETEAKGLHHSKVSDESPVTSSPIFSNLSGTHVVLCSHEAAETPANRAKLSQIAWRMAVLDLRGGTKLNPSRPSTIPNAWEASMAAERRISILHSTEGYFLGHDDLAVLTCMMFPSTFALPAEALKWSVAHQTETESSEHHHQQQEQVNSELLPNSDSSGFQLSQILSNVTIVLESGVSHREKSVEKAEKQSGNKDVEGNLNKPYQPVVNHMFITCTPSRAQKQVYEALTSDLSVALALSWKPDLLLSPGKDITPGNCNGQRVSADDAGASKPVRALDALHRACQWSEDVSILEAGDGITTPRLKPNGPESITCNISPSSVGEEDRPSSLSLQSPTRQQKQSKQIAAEPETAAQAESQRSALKVMETACGKLKPLSEALCQLMERGKRVLVLTDTPSCMRLMRRYLLACSIAHDCCGDEDSEGGGYQEGEETYSPPIDCTSVPFVGIDGERGVWLRTQCALWRAYRCHPGWRALLMSRRAMLKLGEGGGLRLPRLDAVLVVDGDIIEAHELLVANGLSLSQCRQPCDLVKFFTSGTLEEAEARADGVGKSMIRSLLGRPVTEILRGIFSSESQQHAAITIREGKNEVMMAGNDCGGGGSEVTVTHSNTQLFLGGSIEAASTLERILSGLKEASWVQREAYLQEDEEARLLPPHVQVVGNNTKDEATGGSLSLALTSTSSKSMEWLPPPPSVASNSSSSPTKLPLAALFYHSDLLGPLGPAAQFMQCYASLQMQGIPCAPLLYVGLPRLPDIIHDNAPFIPQQPKQTPMLFMPLGESALGCVITLVDRGRTHKAKQTREKRRTTAIASSDGVHASTPKRGLEMPEMWAAIEDALLIALKDQFMGCWNIVRHALETRAASMGVRGRKRSISACRDRLLYLQSLPPGHNVVETGSVHPPLLLHPTVLHCVGAMLIINPLPPSATQGSPAIAGISENPTLPAVDPRSTCGRRFAAVKDAVSRKMKLNSSPGGNSDPTITVAKPHPSHAKAVEEAGANHATVFAPMQIIDARMKAAEPQQ